MQAILPLQEAYKEQPGIILITSAIMAMPYHARAIRDEPHPMQGVSEIS